MSVTSRFWQANDSVRWHYLEDQRGSVNSRKPFFFFFLVSVASFLANKVHYLATIPSSIPAGSLLVDIEGLKKRGHNIWVPRARNGGVCFRWFKGYDTTLLPQRQRKSIYFFILCSPQIFSF